MSYFCRHDYNIFYLEGWILRGRGVISQRRTQFNEPLRFGSYLRFRLLFTLTLYLPLTLVRRKEM